MQMAQSELGIVIFSCSRLFSLISSNNFPLTYWYSMQPMEVNRNYEKKVTKFTDDSEQEFIRQVIRWLYHITSDVETFVEESDSMTKLHDYIDSVEQRNLVDERLVSFTRDFITKRMIPLLSNARFTHVFLGHYADTGFVESENARLAKDPLAPKPNNKLNIACDKLLHMSSNRLRRMKSNDEHAYMSQLTQCNLNDDDNSLLAALSKSVCAVPTNDIMQEYNCRNSEYLYVSSMNSVICSLRTIII